MEEQKAFLFSESVAAEEYDSALTSWYFLFPEFLKKYGVCPFLKCGGPQSTDFRKQWLRYFEAEEDLKNSVSQFVLKVSYNEMQATLEQERSNFLNFLLIDNDDTILWQKVFDEAAVYDASKIKNSTVIDRWKQCIAGPIEDLYAQGFDVQKCFRCAKGCDLPKAKSRMAKSVNNATRTSIISKHEFLQNGADQIFALQKKMSREQEIIKSNVKQAINKLYALCHDPNYPARSPRYENIVWKKLKIQFREDRIAELFFSRKARNNLDLEIGNDDVNNVFQYITKYKDNTDSFVTFWNKSEGLLSYAQVDNAENESNEISPTQQQTKPKSPKEKVKRQPRLVKGEKSSKDTPCQEKKPIVNKKRNIRDATYSGFNITSNEDARLWNLCLVTLAERSECTYLPLHELIVSTLQSYNGNIYYGKEPLYAQVKKMFKIMLQALERNT